MTRRRPLAALLLALALLLTACTSSQPAPTGGATPPGQAPKADEIVQRVAKGLEKGSISDIPMAGNTAAAQDELTTVTAGMGTARPSVKAGAVTYGPGGDTARASLQWSWGIASQPWTYETEVPLVYDNGWKLDWTPSVVHPDLTDRSRLKLTRQVADRGRILGNNGYALVDRREIVRVGIDKSQVSDPAQLDRSARAMAALVNIDPTAYAAKVKAAGKRAFVIASVERAAVAPDGMGAIPGALAQNDVEMLSPYLGFGGRLIGAIGEATKERAAKSGGTVQPGDPVGVSGLQMAHDKSLRGTPGVRVDLVERKDALPADPSAAAQVYPAMLWQQKAVAGQDLLTSLDFDRQKKLEDAVRDAKIPTAVVLVQPSTGKVLAMANSDNAQDQDIAAWGHNPPGSTFKIITALAMLRHGLTMESVTPCPPKLIINGRKVENYPGYPAAGTGEVPLRTAIGYSCNTSFAGYAPKLGEHDLQEAAASLGVGKDYDAGFRSFFGSVPDTTTIEGRMEQTFGQGTLEASPLTMVAVPASVAAGKTVVPWLLESKRPTIDAKPLTAAEATELRKGMAEVVKVQQGKMDYLAGAKTGTAQFGAAGKLQTHIWLVGFTKNDVAAAVFQQTGEHGSDLAPLLQKVLA